AREERADGTMDAIVLSGYEARFHDEAKRSREWLEHQRGKAESGLAALEGMLGNRNWCVGGAVALGAITLVCHIGFILARQPQFFPREKYPGLARLFDSMET